MNLDIYNFGPIKEAQIDFGDLTFFIGSQASGKSLALELLKLLIDKRHIVSTLRNYDYILSEVDSRNILDWYFGEGLHGLFSEGTRIEFSGKPFSPQDLLKIIASQERVSKEAVFYIPAQRILSISDGRPKNFMEFDVSTPYVIRMFSETLRIFMQGGLGSSDMIFPMGNRLKGMAKSSINETIFHDGKVIIDKSGEQRKIKLEVDGLRIPFMAWSAGQKEFMPLLLAIYCLSDFPSSVVNKADYQWVIIEEPEMGLHPRAILSVLLEIIELMQNGYKVAVSTHSSTFLEFVWAFNNICNLEEEEFKEAMNKLFDVDDNSTAANLFNGLKSRKIKTYYSTQHEALGGVKFVDISSLDAFSDDIDISEWGGLSSFAGRSSEIVSLYGR